jgi:tetratricopeptide (TPR) repeat protein
MGNSIFVAAYLIMVFPLTLGRIIETFRQIIISDDQDATLNHKMVRQIIKATIYIFIAGMQIIAVYMSGSRGPLLGLLASVYFLILLLSIFWYKRWLTFTIVGLAIAGATFLIIFNLQNSPFNSLKESPAIGRFGKLLDPESNSALVRQYIWEGTVKLVGIHEPLKFPDGSSDPFNFLRPVLGYGPESMYVAYNQFYQPELGQVEKRNASPDRAHNETWDSIVITGFAGLFVYLSIFSSIFFYGLKWLGLVGTTRRKAFFFICILGGGVAGAISLIILKGIEFLGVGLPFGMILGVVVYLTVDALFFSSQEYVGRNADSQSLLLIFLFSAILGHFVEINFGIAIVATRTLFWTYTGVLLVIGYILPLINKLDVTGQKPDESEKIMEVPAGKRKDRTGSSKPHRKIDRNKKQKFSGLSNKVRYSLIYGVIIGIIIATLGYDYITNTSHSTSPLEIIIISISQLANMDFAISFGVLALIIITWFTGIFLFSSESENHLDRQTWYKEVGLIFISSLITGFLFWILHAISLAVLASFSPANQNDVILQVNNIGSLLTKYYLYIFIIILVAAFLIPEDWPTRRSFKSPSALILSPIFIILIFLLANISNLKVIHADIAFKMADPFTKSNQWKVSTFLYKRALELAPKEDHYYLFLGRSYLEQAKTTESVADQDNLILQAESDLKVAQAINPLNTDHTANLARLYSWWAGKATSNTTRSERTQIASDYYQTAVTLSPNNSTLWDEWAILLMQVSGKSQEALGKLQHALMLDSNYSFTQGLLGDYYIRLANSMDDTDKKIENLRIAAKYYQKAAEVSKVTDQTSKGSYLVTLANVYIMMVKLDPMNADRISIKQDIDIVLKLMDFGLKDDETWKVHEAIAKLYLQIGENNQARFFANQALIEAPSNAFERIQELISQTLSIP